MAWSTICQINSADPAPLLDEAHIFVFGFLSGLDSNDVFVFTGSDNPCDMLCLFIQEVSEVWREACLSGM